MEIRLANLQDANAIADVASVLGYQNKVSENLAIKRLERLLLSSNDKVWVAEFNGQLIGWLHAQHAFRAASADFIEILGLSVADQARLKGAGRALVEKAKEWALDEKIVLRVRTNDTRDGAKKFYTSLGFTTTKIQSVFQL
ncbi:MAG: GNAT family N-acetyltransferase [Gammaproteobacteria bacterium]|nr:GNAT family N-acetyltransferase [Gammaproteobacteria bacterium]MBU2022307.1 GNAT family N-acetyltransferase [Gammaproteobacteria bacterium]MBU2238087.1 GNAT family N-acetyltransferase [Gammaproteobacteria bacterium]MBU2317837.1 GNAT family N-acetyltransferase [Gammaproteobacteria bacterium]